MTPAWCTICAAKAEFVCVKGPVPIPYCLNHWVTHQCPARVVEEPE